MNDSTTQDPRRRLRELLSIPERDRTDAQWDEIIEIEITLAPGNRDTDRPADRSPERRQGAGANGRRNEPRKTAGRASAQRQEARSATAAKTDNAADPSAENRSGEPRAPKRHTRRPRRFTDTGGGNGGANSNGNSGGHSG